jgi:magnesium-transporting ATPase (P-type)
MINGYKSVNEDKKREDKTYFVLLLLCSIILIWMIQILGFQFYIRLVVLNLYFRKCYNDNL